MPTHNHPTVWWLACCSSHTSISYHFFPDPWAQLEELRDSRCLHIDASDLGKGKGHTSHRNQSKRGLAPPSLSSCSSDFSNFPNFPLPVGQTQIPTSDPEVPVPQLHSGLLLIPYDLCGFHGSQASSISSLWEPGLPLAHPPGAVQAEPAEVSEHHLHTPGQCHCHFPELMLRPMTKTLCVHWQTGFFPYGEGSRKVGINPISISQRITDCLVGGSPRQLHQSRAGGNHPSCGSGMCSLQVGLPVNHTAKQMLHPLDGRCWVTGS